MDADAVVPEEGSPGSVVIASEGPLTNGLASLVSEANLAHGAFNAAVHDAVSKAIECGQKLLEIKAALKHGEFTSFVETNLSFGIRTAQRYMQAAERPKLQSKNDTLSLLTEASVRGAIADDNLDGTVRAVEKVVEVAGRDVMEDLAGPSPVASKSAIKAMAEMKPAAIKHATHFKHGEGFRKSTILESVRRSLAAKRRKEEQERQARVQAAPANWTQYCPPQVNVDETERCEECGGREFDDDGGCVQCLGPASPSPAQSDPDAWTIADVLRALTEQVRRILDKCPASDRETMAFKLIALGQEILDNGDLGP